MTRTFVLQGRRQGGPINFEQDLNPEQRAVATTPGGPMLVIAGAGTGKTRALTYRLAWLVERGIEPGRILLATFTNRAAREMLQRVSVLVRRETRHAWGGTFHHIANRLLRQHGARIGIDSNFTILDREDARDLLGACVAESGIAVGARRFPQKAVLADISSALQNTLQPLDAVLHRRFPMFLNLREEVERVLTLYSSIKRRRQLLDYDDLMSDWLRLLRDHADLRQQLGDQFNHLLVDEYQDTNALQGAIVDLLAARHRNVCVVGDDAQSIYSFRGADMNNMLRFKDRYPDAREFRLETNYRSSPQILNLANRNIENNKRRLPKTLRAVRPAGPKPAVVTCPDHFVQSRFIAEYILHLLDQGRQLMDIAVLYRSHWHSPEIQLELKRRNIPYQVRGGLRYFEQAHIKDVLAFLRIAQNPRDELAWHRALKLVPRVGGALARKLWLHISPAVNPLEAAAAPAAQNLFPASTREFYAGFIGLLHDLPALTAPSRMLQQVLDVFYEDYLVSHYDSAHLRQEDIKGFIQFSGQYQRLDSFLADVALSGEFSGETIVRGPEEDKFVTLSTVHQAKGLEWPVVLIPWLADGRFPTDLAVNTPEDEEEERRVFHVAVTRAKDEIYLVVPQIFRRSAQGTILMKPSRFLTELDESITETLLLEEGLSHVTVGAEPTLP